MDAPASCLTVPCYSSSYFQALLKIIITQRETIQTQLGNLKAKDLYLKTLDKSLSCSDGREYVLRNYLEQIPEHSEVSSPLPSCQATGS